MSSRSTFIAAFAVFGSSAHAKNIIHEALMPLQKLIERSTNAIHMDQSHSAHSRALDEFDFTGGLPQGVAQCMNTYVTGHHMSSFMSTISSTTDNPCRDSSPGASMLIAMIEMLNHMDFAGYMQCMVEVMTAQPCPGDTALEIKFWLPSDLFTGELNELVDGLDVAFGSLLAMGDMSTNGACDASKLVDDLSTAYKQTFSDLSDVEFKLRWCDLHDDCWSTTGFNQQQTNSLSSMLGDNVFSFLPNDGTLDLDMDTSLTVTCIGDAVRIIAYEDGACQKPMPEVFQMNTIPISEFNQMATGSVIKACDGTNTCMDMSISLVGPAFSTFGRDGGEQQEHEHAAAAGAASAYCLHDAQEAVRTTLRAKLDDERVAARPPPVVVLVLRDDSKSSAYHTVLSFVPLLLIMVNNQ